MDELGANGGVEALDEEPAPAKLDLQVGRSWTEDQWRALVGQLVSERLVSWEEVASVVLGEMNPPQVGTSLASNAAIKAQYPSRKAWQAVKEWFYSQPLGCRFCHTLLRLEAEHLIPKEVLGSEADNLRNMRLVCKRDRTCQAE